jgi:hypothetical protein
VKEVIDVLPSHYEIIQPKLEWENRVGIEFGLIGVVSLDRHQQIFVGAYLSHTNKRRKPKTKPGILLCFTALMLRAYS